MEPLQADPTAMLGYINSMRDRVELQQAVENACRTQSQAKSVCTDYCTDVPALTGIRTWTNDIGQQNEQFLNTIRSTLLLADTATNGSLVTVSASLVQTALAANGLTNAPSLGAVAASTYWGIAPTSGWTDDPVNAFNGNFVHVETDLPMPGLSEPLGFSRVYNSLRHTLNSSFGPGWSCILDMHLELNAGIVSVHLPDGAIGQCLHPTSAEAMRLLGRNDYKLAKLAETYCLSNQEHTYIFSRGGLLTEIHAPSARVIVFREDDEIRRLDECTSGRSIALTWHNNRIIRADASDGRSAHYRYNQDGVLTDIDCPNGSMHYTTNAGLLIAICDDDNVVIVTNTYDSSGRVMQQRSPYGRCSTYNYGIDRVTTITGDDGITNVMRHDERANLIEMTDGNGATASKNYDDTGNVVSTCDRMGFMTFFEHDDAGRIVKVTDPLGATRRLEWDEDGRVVADWDPAGNITRYEYCGQWPTPIRITDSLGNTWSSLLDERGLIIETIDADGIRTRFDYDRDGQLTRVVESTAVIAQFGYNATGALVFASTGDGNECEFVVDAAGRVLIARSDAGTSTYEYTAAGRPVGGREPGPCAWTNTFGPHGALDTTTDAYGAEVRFTYDTHGNQVVVTDPMGQRFRQEFDAVGNLTAVVLPDERRATQQFDRNGTSIAITTVDGTTIQRNVDAAGRTVALVDPLLRTTTFHFDELGFLAGVAMPDGRQVRRRTDSMGRTTEEQSPSGKRTTTEYTAAGRIATRVTPDGMRARFHYNPTGVCTTLEIDGVERVPTVEEAKAIATGNARTVFQPVSWDVSGVRYSPKHRTTFAAYERNDLADRERHTTTDLEMTLDRRGLLATVSDAQGLATSVARDAHGWVTSEQYVNDRTVNYEHDVLGLVTAIDDGYVRTAIRRDTLGRVVGLRYADGSGWDVEHDASGRVIRRTDADGSRLNEFTYDDSDRLIHATGRTGDSVELIWDADDVLIARLGGAQPFSSLPEHAAGARLFSPSADISRLTSIPPSIAVQLGSAREYDEAGRITRDEHQRIFAYDAAGRIAQSIDSSGASTFDYNAHGLLAAEHSPEGTRRYSYDPTGRLIKLELEHETITYSYDLAGRRTMETSTSGRTVSYHWNRAGELEGVTHSSPEGSNATHRIARDPLNMAYGNAASITSYERSIWGEPTSENEEGWWNGGYWIGTLGVFPERAYDARSRQWCSPDPIATVLGSPGAASAYTYNYFDPINFVDPLGLRPLSQAEFEAWWQRESTGTFALAWDAIQADVWGSILMGLTIAAGVILCFTPLAPIGAGILVGVAVTAGIGLATKTFDPTAVAIGGALGGIGAGVGSAFGSGATALGVSTNAGGRIAVGALGAGAGDAAGQLVFTGGIDGKQVLFATVLGGAGAAAGESVAVFRGSRATITKTPPASDLPEITATPPASDLPELWIDNADSLAHYTRPDGTLDPHRAALHDQIIEDRLRGLKPADEQGTRMLTGGSGSGKSSLRGGDYVDFDAPSTAIVDADDLKKALPEYNELVAKGDPRAADVVHEESSMLSKRLEATARERGHSVLKDGTGGGPYEKFRAGVAERAKAGRVDVDHVTTDVDEAIRRANLRAQEEGRVVSPDTIRETHLSSARNVYEGMRDGIFDSVRIFDNNGTKPSLIADFDRTRPPPQRLQVHDPSSWDRFVAKANGR